MRVFTREVERTRFVEDPEFEYSMIEEYYTEKELNKFGKTVAWGAGIVAMFGVAKLIGGEHYLDIMGDRAKNVAVEDAQLQAQEKYDTAFTNLSPADKFTVQYAGTTTVNVDSKIGGNGLAHAIEVMKSYTFEFGNGCLENTAYDINGGNIDLNAYGLFFHVSAEANIPTAMAKASIDASNPDIMHITSGDDPNSTLHFQGLQSGDAIMPVDGRTQMILDTYGCSPGLQP